MKTLERCKRKSQVRLRKLETEMIAMMDKHAAQVKSLKQRIAFLEELNKDKLTSVTKDIAISADLDGEFSKQTDLRKQDSA